jgi:hypothetical protein
MRRIAPALRFSTAAFFVCAALPALCPLAQSAEQDFAAASDPAPNNIPPDRMNPESKNISDRLLRKDTQVSARLPLDKPDQCPEDLLNHILWRATKGSRTPYPDWAVKAEEDD